MLISSCLFSFAARIQNPAFRAQFQQMCSNIGVDPLASNKGFWAQTLGVGDFYYELAVQMIEVCLLTRPQNGGLIGMEELLSRLRAKRARSSTAASRGSSSSSAASSSAEAISEDDVEYSIRKVSILGNGFRVVVVGGKRMVLSVPTELLTDHVDLMSMAAKRGGGISVVQVGYPSAMMLR